MNDNNFSELDEIRQTKYSTIRPTVQAMEDILLVPHKVLDHGFVRVIDYMGDDSSIVQAARVSYGRGTKKVNEDAGLINYLMRHKHTTPFEMCDIKLHVKLPIFVARQWIRHRTASVNEYSARYSILSKEFYIPEPQHMSEQSVDNKQGRGNILTEEYANSLIDILVKDAEQCYNHYQQMLNYDEEGNILNENNPALARELARMNLTLNYYTEWYWKVNLHNLFHFIRLRADSHAQYEIRVYADAIAEMVKKWVPLAYSAFEDYVMNSCYLSSKATAVLKKMLAGENVTQETSGMSKREWNEFIQSLDIQLENA